MEIAQPRARFDWLVELTGASALAVAAGYAALKAAPFLAWPAPAAMTASGFGFFACGLLAMRSVKPDPRSHALPDIRVAPIETSELLLDREYQEPLLLVDLFEDEALLLEDPIPAANPDSRVVQLFALPSTPTPGQLKERIDQHLSGAPRLAPSPMPAPSPPDASQALYAALAELRRSLR